MKNSILFLFALVVFASCGKEDLPAETPDCVQDIIKELKNEAVRNPPAKVILSEFDGEQFFYVPTYCCDVLAQLYNENCEVICAPDGGIDGQGDGNCPDFVSDLDLAGGTVIWEDDRG